MAKPEDKIFASVRSRLDVWKFQKVVIHYDDVRRLNLKYIRGQYFSHKPKGTPDINVYFKHKNICGIIFIEIKSENDKHRVEQLEFMLKFNDLTNVHYILLKEPNQVDILLENITNHQQSILDNIEL